MTPPIWLKGAATSEQILADVAAAVSRSGARYPQAPIHVVCFCFGGHAAFLASILPGVEQAFDFYGAGMTRMRPGGGEFTFPLLRAIQGQLNGLFGTVDPLIPAEDRDAIGAALLKADSVCQPLPSVECAGADQGFMCEVRGSFDPRRRPGDGVCCLGTDLRFSPGGWPPWQRWAEVVREWCARLCWRLDPSPLSSPVAFCAV